MEGWLRALGGGGPPRRRQLFAEPRVQPRVFRSLQGRVRRQSLGTGLWGILRGVPPGGHLRGAHHPSLQAAHASARVAAPGRCRGLVAADYSRAIFGGLAWTGLCRTGARSMKVALVTGEYPPQLGGVGDHVALLREHLEMRGLETWVITARHGPLQVDHPRTLRLIRRWGFQSMPALVGVLRDLRPDVVHLHYQTGAFGLSPPVNLLQSILRLGRVAGRFVTTFHDLRTPYIFPKAGPLRRLIVRRLFSAGDGSIFVTPEDAAELLGVETDLGELRDVRGKGICVIPVGPNILPVAVTGDKGELRRSLGMAPEAFVVGHIGFRQGGKGMRVLGEALRRVQHLDGKLVVALIGAAEPGSDGRRSDTGSRLGETGRWEVTETGPLEPAEFSRRIAACDACLLPYVDGLSLRRSTFMTAIAHGMPVITTRPQAKLQFVENGENVLLVPRDDPTALSRAIASLAQSPEIRSRMGAAALALSQRFTWQASAESAESIYRRVLAST